jgi:hypothetical protein
MSDTWTPDQCRAKRWNAWPAYDGHHEPHLFYYGPNDCYTGNCGGRYEDEDDKVMSYKARVYKDRNWWVAEYPHGSLNKFSTWRAAINDVYWMIRYSKMIVVPVPGMTLHQEWERQNGIKS